LPAPTIPALSLPFHSASGTLNSRNVPLSSPIPCPQAHMTVDPHISIWSLPSSLPSFHSTSRVQLLQWITNISQTSIVRALWGEACRGYSCSLSPSALSLFGYTRNCSKPLEVGRRWASDSGMPFALHHSTSFLTFTFGEFGSGGRRKRRRESCHPKTSHCRPSLIILPLLVDIASACLSLLDVSGLHALC